MRAVLTLLLLPLMSLSQASMAVPAAVVRPGAQDAALLQFLDRAFDEQVKLSPETQTQLGFKTDQDRLDDYTEAGAERQRALAERQLKDLHARFHPDQLGESARVSYRLFEYDVERSRESFRFRNLRFPVSTNGSPAGEIPVLLINNHKVDTVADAQAYIARLRDTDRVMREVAGKMRS